MATTLIALAASAALSFLASLLSRPKEPKFIVDDRPTMVTLRGTQLPILIGRRRVAPTFAWAGEREVRSSGGGGKGGGGGPTERTYYEAGWQVLFVGPASRLTKILQDGKIIWEGDLDRDNTPSGTQVTADDGEGDFYIYWGQSDQPVNTYLGDTDRVGVESRWPYLCYVVWNKKMLGSSARWPNIEYQIEARPEFSALVDSMPWMEEETEGDGTDGPNPAHVLWQLLTAPAPHGLAIPEERLDKCAFEQLGQLAEIEHQPCHIYITEGSQGTEAIGNIFEDLGVVMPQIGDLLSPVAIRHVDADGIPVLDDDLLVTPAPPPREQIHDEGVADRLVFVIKDQANNFRDMDIQRDDDALAFQRRRSRPRKVSIPTVIDRLSALKVAKRREQEMQTNVEKYSIDVVRGVRMLQPGQCCILPGYGQLRIASVARSLVSRSARIEAVLDQYSGEPGTYVPVDFDEDYNIPIALGAAPDTEVLIVEIPPDPALGDAAVQIAVLRIRANNQISGAEVWLSAEGVSFTQAGRQDAYAAGGELNAAMLASDFTIIEQGPAITPFNGDITGVLDLSGDEASWRTGRQVAVIGDEVFFLRNVTALGGNLWRLDGLIRARYDSDRLDHAIGDKVFIFDRSTIRPISSALLRAHSTISVKTRPETDRDRVDLSDVTAATYTFESPKAFRPLPPDNFHANAWANSYGTGDDVVFAWTYRVRDGQGCVAGEQLAGQEVASATSPRDGMFKVHIYDAAGTTLKRTIPVNDDTGTTTYSNTQLQSDFAGEPAEFRAVLVNELGSWQSRTRTIQVLKV